MPWSETTVMDEKISLISDWCSGVYTISELARAYGVTRPTVYKYIERYEEEGFEGLEEYGRAPQIHPNATPEKTVMRLLKLKTRYKWGAKKIHTLMEERYKSEEIPSISTIDRILKRNGMVKSRRRIRRVEPV
jgi:transposase